MHLSLSFVASVTRSLRERSDPALGAAKIFEPLYQHQQHRKQVCSREVESSEVLEVAERLTNSRLPQNLSSLHGESHGRSKGRQGSQAPLDGKTSSSSLLLLPSLSLQIGLGEEFGLSSISC